MINVNDERKFMREKIIEILAGINDEVLILSDNDNLLEMDVFDSIDIIELIEVLENQFEITINPEDITLENVSTILGIVNLVRDKIQHREC